MQSQQHSYPTASIDRAAARTLVDAARAVAARIGIEVAVAVTDSAGNLKAFERTDGAPFLTADVAIDKAWTAASYGYPTHVWNAYITGDPKVAQLAHRPRLVAVGGGYPVNEDGKLSEVSESPAARISKIKTLPLQRSSPWDSRAQNETEVATNARVPYHGI